MHKEVILTFAKVMSLVTVLLFGGQVLADEYEDCPAGTFLAENEVCYTDIPLVSPSKRKREVVVLKQGQAVETGKKTCTKPMRAAWWSLRETIFCSSTQTVMVTSSGLGFTSDVFWKEIVRWVKPRPLALISFVLMSGAILAMSLGRIHLSVLFAILAAVFASASIAHSAPMFVAMVIAVFATIVIINDAQKNKKYFYSLACLCLVLATVGYLLA